MYLLYAMKLMLFALLLLHTLQGQSVLTKLPKICINRPHFSIAAGTPSFETTKIVSLLIFLIFVSAYQGILGLFIGPIIANRIIDSRIPGLVTDFDGIKHLVHISKRFSDTEFN